MTAKQKKPSAANGKADKLIKVTPETHRKLKIEAATREKSIGKLLEKMANGFKN